MHSFLFIISPNLVKHTMSLFFSSSVIFDVAGLCSSTMFPHTLMIFLTIMISFSYSSLASRWARTLFSNMLRYSSIILQSHMNHVHGPNCGCAEYMGAENANDLYGAIETDKVRCLNEEVANSGKKVFKEFDNRFDKSQTVASDCDGELLFVIPFSSQVKVRSICVIAKDETHYPRKMRLYVNNENVDFSLVEHPPVQEFDIPPNLSGDVHSAVKVSKFSSVHKLIVHLSNPQQEVIQVAYIQIKGENTNIKRQAVQTVYEVQPNAEKKDLKDLEKNPFQMG